MQRLNVKGKIMDLHMFEVKGTSYLYEIGKGRLMRARSKKSWTSYNNAFTRRALRPLVHQRRFGEANSGGQPCEPNRVAAAPLGLKVLGFVNAGTLDEIHHKSLKEEVKC